MSLTASDVASLTSSLLIWEASEYVFAGLVTLACAGEFTAEFTDWFTGGVEGKKKRLEKRSTLLRYLRGQSELNVYYWMKQPSPSHRK
jgi:hypothetical protein